MMFGRPMIVVVGATGTGKTKLAVELCLRYAGEVISTDSMQVYRGLDLATNKATTVEMKGVPHHMIGILSPLTMGFTVTEFRDRALGVMEDIWRREKVPVLVGGTSYYMEGILWNVLLSEVLHPPQPLFSSSSQSNALPSIFVMEDKEFLRMPVTELYAKLKEVDPEFAGSVHPRNHRQILRALQFFSNTGRQKSAVIKEQASQEGGSCLGGPLRFKKG